MGYALTLDRQGRAPDLAADLAQSIGVIVTTPKGTKIHDPEFGADLWGALDRPMGQVPSVVAEVVRALRRDEPRVAVESVEPDFTAAAQGHITLLIRYRIVASGDAAQTTVIL